MTTPVLRLGTRRSKLARTQSKLVGERLTAVTGIPVELVDIVTEGDVNRAPLVTMGGAGVFVSAVRDALLRGEVDFVVHSLKDLPTTPEPGIDLVAVPGREDPRDALIARDNLTLGELPVGSKVATGSPRRQVQLEALGFGIEVIGIRGNVGTRIEAVTSGAADAVVLANAGLRRLGETDRITEVIDPLQMLPAPGQGALAVECRAITATSTDQERFIAKALAELDDAESRACVIAERAVLSRAEAGCSAPLGALAEVVEGDAGLELSLAAVLADADGHLIRHSVQGRVVDARTLGEELADLLLERIDGNLPTTMSTKGA
ncbi:hydroxymethylbilane synthase [Saxibacter everestensis]|uniref:Porphobilinogen deaminase n=1 Tax=Saxibacter everestensis TaxID=2909229 RepID=A0ABY8QPX9_9MICO|nr:hydroxymethylbilane synthase [Brevibacteriaceae bacterium ZFBP1038]